MHSLCVRWQLWSAFVIIACQLCTAEVEPGILDVNVCVRGESELESERDRGLESGEGAIEKRRRKTGERRGEKMVKYKDSDS